LYKHTWMILLDTPRYLYWEYDSTALPAVTNPARYPKVLALGIWNSQVKPASLT
jgi:hypothetical protein